MEIIVILFLLSLYMIIKDKFPAVLPLQWTLVNYEKRVTFLVRKIDKK